MNFYYENSNGRKIDLNKPPFLGVKSNDLFSFKWSYITQGQSVQKIVKFEKAMVEKKFQVIVSGTSGAAYLGNLELFLQLTDVDINNLQMGKLWMDDYYLEGYIFASTKNRKYLNTTKTIIDLSVICEKGNWQSEETWRFRQGYVDEEDPQYTGYGILYPYDYAYDYSAPFSINTILNESYMDTDFELTYYGPSQNPEVTIGQDRDGNPQVYKIYWTLSANDRLVINSKKKTAVVIDYEGNEQNVFQWRDTNYDLFAKIRGGGNAVRKKPDDVFEIKLFYERSEPKYTEAKWT